MIEITKAQRSLLTSASTAGDAALPTTEGSAASFSKSVAASLIKKGLLILVPAADGASRLLITTKGREAIGGGEAGGGELPPPDDQIGALGAAIAPSAPTGKIASLVHLLEREQGATMANMMQATGWQAHSVRGALSGAIKKKLGLAVASTKIGDERVYRIAVAAR